MYKAIRFSLFIPFIFLLSALFSANAQTIGVAVKIDDQVRSNKQSSIKTQSNIFRNEQLRSNGTGLGQFKFSDGTKMVLGPNSNLKLDNLIYNPDGETFKKFVLNSTAGAVRVISGDSASSAYEINTPVGTLGIRGTAFDMNHYRGRTYVMVLDGSVQVCSSAGDCQTLRRKCQLCVIDQTGNVSDPVVPRRSNFDANSLDTFFPFVANQSKLEREFRVRFLRRCRIGITGTSFSGANGPDPDASPDPSPAPAPAPSPAPAADPGDNGGDDSGDDSGDDGGDDGGRDGGDST